MVAPSVTGLSPADLVGIRESLAAGKRPRVVFTARAGQMAGNAGHIVELADPAASDEWIVVQFGRDELPFSPGDLAVSGRQPAGRQAAGRQPIGPQPIGRQPAGKPLATPAAHAPQRIPAVRAASAPPPRHATATREETRVAARRTPATVAPTADPVSPPVSAPAVARAPRQPRPPKTPAPLVVTLCYADQRWTVAAQHGSKSLAKPYAITPTEALRMVALIQVPGVHDAVASIIAAERVEAENRAQRLRAELAEIESRLAELSRRQ